MVATSEIKKRLEGVKIWVSEIVKPDFAQFPDEILFSALVTNNQKIPNTFLFRRQIYNGLLADPAGQDVLSNIFTSIEDRLRKNITCMFPPKLQKENCLRYTAGLFTFFCEAQGLTIHDKADLADTALAHAIVQGICRSPNIDLTGISYALSKEVTDWLVNEYYLKVSRRKYVYPTKKADLLVALNI